MQISVEMLQTVLGVAYMAGEHGMDVYQVMKNQEFLQDRLANRAKTDATFIDLIYYFSEACKGLEGKGNEQ